MGHDIEVCLIHGYKICLANQNFLDTSILEGDDYQLIHEPDCRDELIETYVIHDMLKDFLQCNPEWNIYVLTSSQEDPDLENSWFFVYDKRQQLFYGRAPDYETGLVEMQFQERTPLLGVEYKHHWIVEGSW